ncbi:hypothetical protein BHE74_00027745 [Ensete ventricosum]|nr:hypothetical protein BHE74_00027745 [Ensete ventricosum]RZS18275.1 hypothetical protein BHM03_00050511 [Ensete ventricosum]
MPSKEFILYCISSQKSKSPLLSSSHSTSICYIIIRIMKEWFKGRNVFSFISLQLLMSFFFFSLKNRLQKDSQLPLVSMKWEEKDEVITIMCIST